MVHRPSSSCRAICHPGTFESLRENPYCVLSTQTRPAIRPRTQTRTSFGSRRLPMFRTQLHERDPFRAIFAYVGTLSGLDPKQVRGNDAARGVVRKFVNEVDV